jgi:hypothetical protein
MTVRGSSFEHLVVWRGPGDLPWRYVDNEGKGEIAEAATGSRLILQVVKRIGMLRIGHLSTRC